MIVDEVIARVETASADLAGRVEGAGELTALVRERALPQMTPAAFVLPLGLRAGAADSVSGLFRQLADEVVAVVLVVEVAGDVTGGAALPTIDALVAGVIDGVCGWKPAGEIGSFRLDRGRLVAVDRGVVIYQLDFAIPRQLRIQA